MAGRLRQRGARATSGQWGGTKASPEAEGDWANTVSAEEGADRMFISPFRQAGARSDGLRL